MHQPFLDLMNYDAQHTGEDQQTFLCTAQKTDGRFGFNPEDRFYAGTFVFAGTTPYGMQVMESQFIEAILTFGVFNHHLLKALCESPLLDACVVNLVDNAVSMKLEDEPLTYTFTHVGHNYHGNDPKENHWGPCGCDGFVEWDGKHRRVSLVVTELINSTGRMTVIPFHDRFLPRYGSEKELAWSPHLGAINENGDKLCTSLINCHGVDTSKRK